MDARYLLYIQRWKQGLETGGKGWDQVTNHVRRYLHAKYQSRCSLCSWSETNPKTGKIPVEIEHIDGNSNNNAESNLTLLCPNCHALTPTYKGANKGFGRKRRREQCRVDAAKHLMLEAATTPA